MVPAKVNIDYGWNMMRVVSCRMIHDVRLEVWRNAWSGDRRQRVSTEGGMWWNAISVSARARAPPWAPIISGICSLLTLITISSYLLTLDAMKYLSHHWININTRWLCDKLWHLLDKYLLERESRFEEMMMLSPDRVSALPSSDILISIWDGSGWCQCVWRMCWLVGGI